MTGTLISLISIFLGIIAANLLGYFKIKYSFGLTGNTIIGVFGSILFIKTFGRLGFDPWSIMRNNSFDIGLFLINSFMSLLGGSISLIAIKYLVFIMNKKKNIL